jgi:pseudaminic acid biosynthesis-associated methylase
VSTRRPSRLEDLWAGEFGDAYVERNLAAETGRREFWARLLEMTRPANALEVGCNVGANLRWLVEDLGAENVAGIDINEKALEILRERLPGVDARAGTARDLPFTDRSFELVFTIGVLIHQGTDELREVMAEIVRCSSRWVLCGEYYAEEETEVPYRGEQGALFKRDFGRLYLEAFPELRPAGQGFLPKGEGSWDDVTWWLLERQF